MIKLLALILVVACAIAWPLSGIIDNWMWDYEPKEKRKWPMNSRF